MLAFAFRSEEEIKVPARSIARFERANQAEIAVELAAAWMMRFVTRSAAECKRGAPYKADRIGYAVWVFLLSDIVMFAASLAATRASPLDRRRPGARALFTSVWRSKRGCLRASHTCGLGLWRVGVSRYAVTDLRSHPLRREPRSWIWRSVFGRRHDRDWGAAASAARFSSRLLVRLRGTDCHVPAGLLAGGDEAQVAIQRLPREVSGVCFGVFTVLHGASSVWVLPVHVSIWWEFFHDATRITSRARRPSALPDVKQGTSSDLLSTTIVLVSAVVLTPCRSGSPTHSRSGPACLSRALTVLAMRANGIHLVFFLHVHHGPDNTNNVMGAGVSVG